MGLPEVVPDVLRQRAGGGVGLVGGDDSFLVLTASALLSPGDDLVGATTHVPALGSGEVETADTAALFSIDAEDVFAQEEVEQAMFGVIRVGGAQARGVGVAPVQAEKGDGCGRVHARLWCRIVSMWCMQRLRRDEARVKV